MCVSTFQEYRSSYADYSVDSDAHAQPTERHADLVDQHYHGRTSSTKVTSLSQRILVPRFAKGAKQ